MSLLLIRWRRSGLWYVHCPLSVMVTLTPRKYLGPTNWPVIVYVNTIAFVVFSGPFKLTSVENPVVPPPLPVPTPRSGWLSCCWSCAQSVNRLDSMLCVRSEGDKGG